MNPEQQEMLIMRLRKENEELKKEIKRLRDDQDDWFRFSKEARESREEQNAFRVSRMQCMAIFIALGVASQFPLDRADFSYWGYAWRALARYLVVIPLTYLFIHLIKDFFFNPDEVPGPRITLLICLIFTAVAVLAPELLPLV